MKILKFETRTKIIEVSHISEAAGITYNRETENVNIDGDWVTRIQYTNIPITLVPGVFQLADEHGDVYLIENMFNPKKLCTTVSSSMVVKREIDLFLQNFDLYTRRGLLPKRNVLFYSPPGQGKTSSIKTALNDYLDGSTLVLIWSVGSIHPFTVKNFLETGSLYDPSVKKVIILMEDINGAASEQRNGTDPGSLSALLNLLDGSSDTFKIPTMVIATTNFPEDLVEAIGNRPGRFDRVQEISPLKPEERKDLCKFYAHDLLEVGDEVTEARFDRLSIAHLEEAVNRAILERKPLVTTLLEMLDYDKLFKKQFTKREKLGFE